MPKFTNRLKEERAASIEKPELTIIGGGAESVPGSAEPEIDEDLISGEDFPDYPMMYCVRDGRRAETIWLHEAPEEKEVGSFPWYEITRVQPNLKRKSDKVPETIILHMRGGGKCLIDGFNLSGLMARLSAHRVLQVWAYDDAIWPARPAAGKPIVTGIKYVEAV